MKKKYVKPQMEMHAPAMSNLICSSFSTNSEPVDDVVMGSRDIDDFWNEDEPF